MGYMPRTPRAQHLEVNHSLLYGSVLERSGAVLLAVPFPYHPICVLVASTRYTGPCRSCFWYQPETGRHSFRRQYLVGSLVLLPLSGTISPLSALQIHITYLVHGPPPATYMAPPPHPSVRSHHGALWILVSHLCRGIILLYPHCEWTYIGLSKQYMFCSA